MRPYGEVTGKACLRRATRCYGGKNPPRYRREKRKAEAAAEWRQPRKRERRLAKRESHVAP